MSDDTTTREAVERVRARIKESQRDKEDGDEASWGYETGILLTRNEAKRLLAALDRVTRERDVLRKDLVGALAALDAATTAERDRIRQRVAGMAHSHASQQPNSQTIISVWDAEQVYNAALADVARIIDADA